MPPAQEQGRAQELAQEQELAPAPEQELELEPVRGQELEPVRGQEPAPGREQALVRTQGRGQRAQPVPERTAR